MLRNTRFFIFADLAAASPSQNGGASQEGKQAENYRMFHISSPFDLKAGKGLGKIECVDIENARLAESCKIFLPVNISRRNCAASSQGHCQPDENPVNKIDKTSSAGRSNLHGDGEFAGSRAIGLTRVYTAALVIAGSRASR